MPAKVRNLVIVLGDQLDADAAALQGFDPAHDMVWMAEVAQESTHVWSSKQRIAVFLSAMRHFAEHLRQQGRRCTTPGWTTPATRARWVWPWARPSRR